MKKLLSIFVFLAFVISFAIVIQANESNQNIYYYGDLDIEVRFEDDNTLNEHEKQRIADILAYDISPVESRAWCWLTGHSKVIHTVSVVTHKVRTSSPRCLDETYNVTTCENCNYYEEELVNQRYIICCPVE